MDEKLDDDFLNNSILQNLFLQCDDIINLRIRLLAISDQLGLRNQMPKE